MQFTFTEGQGGSEHLFGPDSLAEAVGKDIPITIEGEADGSTLRIIRAEVTTDGVSITCEIPDNSKLAQILGGMGLGEGWSIGDR